MVKVGGKVAALTQSLPARGYLGPWDEYTVKLQEVPKAQQDKFSNTQHQCY